MKLGLLLLALGYGYRVYADASKEKGNLRSLGQWIGAIVMAISLVASVFLVSVYSSKITGKGHCPWMTRQQEDRHFTVQLAPTPVAKK